VSEPPSPKLCTFDVATHLGRHSRLGGVIDGRIVDLNFAAAWYLAQTGEGEPQRLADALLPADMATFLRTGLRAIHTMEDLFSGAGPSPGHWWRLDAEVPLGPNGETLVYRPGEVRLRAPVPGRGVLGPEDVVPAGECRAGAAVITSAAGTFFTALADFGAVRAMGPLLARPGDLARRYAGPPVLALAVRVNGEPRARLEFEAAPTYGGGAGDISPVGDAQRLMLGPGDLLEIDLDQAGVLRNRVG
jgi:hypothetical protein